MNSSKDTRLNQTEQNEKLLTFALVLPIVSEISKTRSADVKI